MAKHGRHPRRGSSGSKRGRPRPGPPHIQRRRDEPDLLDDVRRALRSNAPLDLLAQASMLLNVIDPRSDNPFDRAAGERPELPSRDELVASFIDIDCPETSALLTVLAEMVDDELVRVRIRRELARRPHPMPEWLRRLSELAPCRTVEISHVLRDGDNVIVGTRLPTGHELTALVYIDYNLGTVAKDAFVTGHTIEEHLALIREHADDPDMSYTDIDVADARARITEAIDIGAITFPPFESETWPACRPLVEWMTRVLPEGGNAYQRPECTEADVRDLAGRFFASPFGAPVDDTDRRGLLETLLWFATDYGSGDPFHWSPTRVEILLTDWLPRKVVADVAYLSKAPELLRALIRFSHHERGIRPLLTDETLAAVDEFERAYQQTIRSPRLRGPAALLATIGALDAEEELDYREIMLDVLRRAVGGDEALHTLDDQPLPDEPLTWDGIPADIHARVGEVVAACDHCCDELLDVEHRTACRRLLARVAAGDPEVFRRKGRTNTAATAVCWIIGKANDLFSPGGGGMLVKDLLSHFGLKKGGASQRATTMLRAGGFEIDHYGEISLGSPDYLVSQRRRRIIDLRDRYLGPATTRQQ